MAKNGQDQAEQTCTVTVVKTDKRQIELKQGTTVREMLSQVGLELREGEVVEREGEVLELDAVLEDGDVAVITEDDENGR